MSRTILAYLSVFLSAPFLWAQPSHQPASIEKETAAIEQARERFIAAWNQHDPLLFSEAFSTDADVTNWRGDHMRSRKAVLDFHGPMFKGPVFSGSTQSAKTRRIRFLRPDIAVVDVDWDMTGAKTPEGVARPPRKGLLSWVMVKEQERWLIAVMHNTDFTAAAMAPPTVIK